MIFGTFCILIYFGNLIYKVHVPFLLNSGLVSFTIGFLLRQFKLSNK
jgi:hypothetical protein